MSKSGLRLRSYIKDVVQYCKAHGLVKSLWLHSAGDAPHTPPRNDRYSKKTLKYFVEYSDKESVVTSRTETETHKEEQEALRLDFSHVC